MGSLIFLATLLLILFSAGAIGFYMFRRDWARIRAIFLLILAWLTFYALILVAVSLASRPRVLGLNQDKCFDEWCVAVTRIDRSATGENSDFIVHLRVSNHGRGRAQRPDHPHIYVIDSRGNEYEESAFGKSVYEDQFGQLLPVNSRIEPQSAFETVLVFRLPAGSTGEIVLAEGGFPTQVIIGDENSFLHKKSVVLIEE